METTKLAVEAHRRMLLARAVRDAALRQAMSEGAKPYALAKAFRSSLGEGKAITAEGIRRIWTRTERETPPSLAELQKEWTSSSA